MGGREGGGEWGNLSCDLQASSLGSPGRRRGRLGKDQAGLVHVSLCKGATGCPTAAQLSLQASPGFPTRSLRRPSTPLPAEDPSQEGSPSCQSGRCRRKTPAGKFLLASGLTAQYGGGGSPGYGQKSQNGCHQVATEAPLRYISKNQTGLLRGRNSQAGWWGKGGEIPPTEPRRSRVAALKPGRGGGQLPAFPAGGPIRGQSGPDFSRWRAGGARLGSVPRRGGASAGRPAPRSSRGYLRRRRGRA